VVTRATLARQLDDLEYWRAKRPAERLAAVEILRRQAYGGEDATGSRLQQVSGYFSQMTFDF
jgi:hypothetical protein